MLEVVELFKPSLIISPFLATKVPAEIYNNICTLIVHPGVAGDAGPSAIDWVLMGDDGTIADSNELPTELAKGNVRPGKPHWGITVLQAVEQLDAGSVWAWEQFQSDIDEPGLTKSSLYRGPITRAAVKAVPIAISRIVKAIGEACDKSSNWPNLATFHADPKYAELSVADKATSARHIIELCSRLRSVSLTPRDTTRCKSSGVSAPLTRNTIQARGHSGTTFQVRDVKTRGVRNRDVCIETSDKKGVWITHPRRPKVGGGALWPKIPAVPCLLEDGVLTPSDIAELAWPADNNWSPPSFSTLQDISIHFKVDSNGNKVAYLYFDFYNGATSTTQCSHLIEAMDHIISQSTPSDPSALSRSWAAPDTSATGLH